MILAAYVDDILITGTNREEIKSLKLFNDAQFKIKDLGDLLYFLGIEVIRKERGILLTQQKFAKGLIQKFDCGALIAFSSPRPACIKLNVDDVYLMMIQKPIDV